MERPWLKTYEELGLQYEIDNFPPHDSSIIDILEKSFQSFSSLNAFYFMGKSMTYAQFDTYSLQIAAYLQSRGLKKGDRVAVMLPNVMQYPIIAAAVLRAGLILVNVNPLYTARELGHQLKDSGAKMLFILENFAATYQAIDEKLVEEVVICRVGDMLGSLKGGLVNMVLKYVKKQIPAWHIPNHKMFKQVLFSKVSIDNYKRPSLTLDDTAVLQYTGGTTGVSKGAELTHKNIVCNVLQGDIYMGEQLEVNGEQNIICALPLYHIFAFTVSFLAGVQRGAANVLIPNPRDLPSLVKAFDTYKPQVFPAVNTLFNALLHDKKFRKLDHSNMTFAMGGGMAVQKSVSDEWEKLTGVSILQGYGLSETSPIATGSPVGTPFNGTIGLPMPSTDIAIMDDEGNMLAIGEAGEICVRGPQVMKGYWNRPEATAEVMTDDGFFRTGDIGVMDEKGYFKVVDRKKDMILVSGFNVYPNELEDVLASHPKILEAGVIGIPDERSGEIPKAYIVKADDSLTKKEVKAFCHDELTGYKRPRVIEFIDELPKSNVGKILRKDLRKLEDK
ncbi:MAG: long-chain fatty acid--CoA ligase [Gammaproteobacteria bacterium]|nr:MAG: long-chain fatty acid--CoA ligase [Gammaproteobacteria bacterium]